MGLDKKMAILVVDDSPIMRGIIRTALRDAGFSNVIEAEDGDTGLEKLKQQDVDLILCDWQMQRMSGLDLLKAVKAEIEFSDIPFIMVTAEAQQEQVIMAIKEGVNNYLIKPFTSENLLQKINLTMQRLAQQKTD